MTGAGVAGTCAKRGYSWLQQRERQAQTRQELTSSVECSGFSPKCDERLLQNVTRICWTPSQVPTAFLCCPLPPRASPPTGGTGRWRPPPWKVCPLSQSGQSEDSGGSQAGVFFS